MMPEDLVRRLHASPLCGVLAITGGGSGLLERLLTTPGASATVLEATVPYSEAALVDWLGRVPPQACSEFTARQMALHAFGRARGLDPEGSESFGLAITASLATDRPKRGEHRAHLVVHTADTAVRVAIRFEKGRRSRAEEEAATTHAALAALAHAAGLHEIDLSKTPPGIEAECESLSVPAEWRELLLGHRQAVALHGAPEPGAEPVCLFPGSFNPPHDGHAQIVRDAARRTGLPVVCELAIHNVDKPSLDLFEIRRRVDLLRGKPVWLTGAPRFVEKARLAPGTIFAVGADTVCRLADPAYAAGEASQRDRVIEELASLNTRLLVYGRLIEGGFCDLGSLELPARLADLCEGVSEEAFRADLSSTQLRQAERGEPA